MSIKHFLIFTLFCILFALSSRAQTLHHFTGPLGFYHISFGKTYLDTTGKDSLPVQQVFNQGEPCFPSQAFDQDMGFEAEVDSCVSWHTNRIMGMIQPVTERGRVNQPGDTNLMHPYPLIDSPGMIQAAQRFSRLSQKYSGFYGAVIDDWSEDTFTTRRVHEALLGKPVDAAGNVCFTCPATTPYNKLFGVMYVTGPYAANLPYIDGISYWPNRLDYWGVDAAIDDLKKNWPQKELFIGIYIYNSKDHFVNPYIVHYLLSHAIDRYDNGDINGITLFPGPYLAQNHISLAQWNAYALPHWLDSLYFPYLGAIKGLVYDCNTGAALQGVSVRVYCTSRSTGDTLVRSYQQTSTQGLYSAGLWAGNRLTDSTKYGLVFTKVGYAPETTMIYVKRNLQITMSDIGLCPTTNIELKAHSSLNLSPNPVSDNITILDKHITNGDKLEFYSVTGTLVYTTLLSEMRAVVSVNQLSNGMYFVVIRSNGSLVKDIGKMIVAHQ